ncbi:MAG: hypothetical protein IJH55_06200, partial [Romboutsia sp.]|nr:hypothetical protein [Romboutsia sp.]
MSNVICSKNNGDEIIIKNEECSGGKISKYDITNDENTINLNRFGGVSGWLYNYYNPSTEYSNYITYSNNSSDMIRRIADDDSIFSTAFRDDGTQDAYIRIPTNISYSLQLLGNSLSDGEDITTYPSTEYTKPMGISSIMNCGNTTISDDGSNTKISVSDLLTVTIPTSFINSLVDSGFCNTNTSTNYYIDISEYCFRLPESQMYDSSDVVRQRDIKYTYNLSGINVNAYSLSLNNNIPNYMNFMSSYINDTDYPIITALYKIIYSESGKATEYPKIEILKNNCEYECECETISASLSENLFGFNREASKNDVNEFIDKFTYSVNALIDFILSNTNNDNILDDMTEYIKNLFLDKYDKLAKWVIWSDFVQAIDIENIGEWVGFVKQNSLLVLENDITGSLNNDTIGKYTFVIKGTDGHHEEYFSMAPIPIPKSDYNFDLSEISDSLTSFGKDKYEISEDYTPPLRDKVFEANAKEICEAITCEKGTSECYQVKSNGNINFDIGLDIKIGNYYEDNNGNEYSGITDTYLMNTLTKSYNNRLVAIGYQDYNKKVQLRMNQNELSKRSNYYFKINYKGSSTDIRYIRGDKINDYLSSDSPHTNQCLGAVFTSTCLDKKYYTNGDKGGTDSKHCDNTNYGNLIYGFAKGQDDYDDGAYIKVNTESGGKINRSTNVNWLGYNGNFDLYGSYGYTGAVD